VLLGIRWGSLRTKIIAWSFVPTAVILIAVALVAFYAYQRVTQDLVIERNRELSRRSAGQLVGELTQYSNTLSDFGRESGSLAFTADGQKPALKEFANRLSVFDSGTVVLDNHGVVVGSLPARTDIQGSDWSGQPYFRQLLRTGSPAFSDVLPEGPLGADVIVVAVPIRGVRNEFEGTAIGMFRASDTTVSALYGSIVKLRLGTGEEAYLVDGKGQAIYHTDTGRIGEDLSQQEVVKRALRGEAGALRTWDSSGRAVVASYSPVPGTNWALVTSIDWGDLMAPSLPYTRFLVVLLVLGVLIPAGFVAFGVRRITQPIEDLIRASQEVASGKFGHTISARTGDELEVLVRQFNIMSNELQDSYTALREREERLALVIEGTNDGIWDWNVQTGAVYYSPRWKSMIGYAEDEIPNDFDEWRRRIHPGDVGRVLSELEEYLYGGLDSFQPEFQLQHKDGSYKWILARGIAVREASGKALRLTGSHTDVTERRHAEEALRASEAEMRALLAALSDVILVLDPDGRYLRVAPTNPRLLYRPSIDLVGKTLQEIFPPAQAEFFMTQVRNAMASSAPVGFEYSLPINGSDIWFAATVSPILDDAAIWVARDVTEQRRAREALREAYLTLERRVAERTRELETLISVAAVVSRSLDLKEIMTDALDKTMEAMNLEGGATYVMDDAEQVLNMMAHRGLSEPFVLKMARLPLDIALVGQQLSGDGPIAVLVRDYPESPLLPAIVQEGLQLVVGCPFMVKDRLVGGAILSTRRERTLTSEELALLAGIGRQIGLAVENARLYDQAEAAAATAERNRLARELHDSVTQSLFSVTLYAEAAVRLIEGGNAQEAADHVRSLRDTSQDALREMRLLIFELRPPALAKTGLADALQARLRAVEARGGVQSELEVSGTERLPLALQEELYHVTQEILNNVLKHAHAQHVRVQIELCDPDICLEIRDDGVGFDPATAAEAGGMGLRGVRERAQKLGGTLEVESAPGRGTVVRLKFRNPATFPASESAEPIVSLLPRERE